MSTRKNVTSASELLTAILPLKAYHEPFLRAALQSIFGQDSNAWRLLVVVEPRDKTRFARLLAVELADARVGLVVNTGRKLAGAINSGMRAACTPFVAILLGDDRWATDAVSVLNANIRSHPEIDFFHSARRIVDENDQPLSGIYPARTHFAVEDFVKGSPVKHLLCWRREFGLAIGGLDEHLNSVGPDDYDFPWMMAEHGARFLALQECLYIYRDHREAFRLTTHMTLAHHKAEIDRILRKHGVPRELREKRLAASEATYLRQCLYRSRLDQLWKRLRGFDPRSGWRSSYR